MAKTRAVALLETTKTAYRLLTFDHDPDYPGGFGAEVVDKLGVDADATGKTLVCDLGGKHFGAAIVPVAGRLDLKAAAAAFGVKKLRLAEVADAERITGYVHGGISPLGQKTALPTVIDETLAERELIVVSAGARGAQIELAPADLIALTKATVASIR